MKLIKIRTVLAGNTRLDILDVWISEGYGMRVRNNTTCFERTDQNTN
jgi:hypothetical protein